MQENEAMRDLLREYLTLMLNEGDRGGIDAQKFIADILKQKRPKFDYISNKKGQQNPDVTILLKNVPVGFVESKSIVGGSKLTTVFDKTVNADSTSPLDNLARSLYKDFSKKNKNILPLPGKGPVIGKFLEAIGGSLSSQRPVSDADAKRTETNPGGYSHKFYQPKTLPRGVDPDTKFFLPNPEDAGKIANREKIAILLNRGGNYYALGTVKPMNIAGKTILATTSTPRPWVTSGKAPTEGGVSSSPEVIANAYDAMVEHWSQEEGGDNYFILVGNGAIYPFIVPGKEDVLNLSALGVKELSASDITSAGLSTYGNPGFGKMRLALKASFALGKSFTLSK